LVVILGRIGVYGLDRRLIGRLTVKMRGI
jgi:hypothetical protein